MKFIKTIILVLGVVIFVLPCIVLGQNENNLPIANNDSYWAKESKTLTVNSEEGVLANDIDLDEDSLTVSVKNGPSYAKDFLLQSDGSFTYTPKDNFVGTDTFTYIANDGAGDSNEATVTIYVGKVIPIDIKPGSCPNPINVKSWGVLPVAILGAADFDVTQIDKKSITLAGVKPLWFGSSIEDVATPYDGTIEDCSGCSQAGPDGYKDLTLKFSTQAIVKALGPVNDEECIVLQLTGILDDGTEEGMPIIGEDVVRILKKGNSFGWGINTFEWPKNWGWEKKTFEWPKWELPKFEWPKKK